MGSKADLSGKALSKSFANISLSKGFVKTRKELKNNIRNLFSDAQKMINEGNTSGAFNLKMQTEMNKFAVSDVSSDDRRKATQGEINKLLTLQKSLTTEISKEHDKQIAALKKEFEAEENVRLSQEKILSLTKDTANARQSGGTNPMFAEISGGIKTLSNGIGSISNGFKNWLRSLTGVAVMFRILGGVVSRIIGSIASVYETAASYQEAMNLYNTALGKYASQATEWANTISKALYLDPKDVMQYTGALYNLVKGLGASSDAAYLMSKNLTQLSYDMSSFLNIDVQSAYEKLTSAITGQSRAIASSGVALKQGALQEKLYSLGIKEKLSTLTESSKVYLRYIQIMDQTKNMQMDLGKTIITPENALRTIKTQFTLLAREIGNVFIPIIMKAVPYIMALTQILGNLAKKLADAFGFKVADIDYTSATEGADKLSKKLNGVGASAKKAKNSINRTLAAFDDLNVVESKSSSSGAGGGGLKDVTDQLGKYLKDYNMLGKLNDQFKDQVDAATKNLYKMFDVVKKIGIAFATWKIIKLVGNIESLISKFVKGYKEGNGFAGVISKLAKRFSEGYKYAAALGGEGLGKIQYGISNMLGPIGTVIAKFGLIATNTILCTKNMKEWDGTTNDLTNRLVGNAGLTAALTTVGAIALGPFTAVGVAIGGVVGSLVGYNLALDELRQKEEYQKKYDTLYDGQGISLNRLKRELKDTFTPLEQYNTKMDESNKSVTEAETKVTDAKNALIKLHDEMESNSPNENKDKIKELKKAYNDLKDSIITLNEKEKNRQKEQIDRLLKEGAIDKNEHDARIQRLNELNNLIVAQTKGYTKELADLDAKLATNQITQDEYNKEVQKLASTYALVSDAGEDLTLNMASMYDVASKGFDLKNPEKLKTQITELTEKFDALKTQTETTWNTTHSKNVEQLKDYDTTMARLERLGKMYESDGKTYTKEYQAVYDARHNLWTTDVQAQDVYFNNMQTLGGTYKDIMLTMLGQIDEAGLTTNKNAADVVSTITGSLDKLKDYDASKSTYGIFNSFATNFEKDGKTFSIQAQTKFQAYAPEIANKFELKLSNSMKKAFENSKLQLSDGSEKYGTSLGEDVAEGLGTGLNNNKSKKYIDTNVNLLAKNTFESAKGKNAFDINSPSHLFEKIGDSAAEGVGVGITKGSSKAESAVNTLATNMANTLKKNKLSIDVSDNVTGSLNKILTKLQTFCNNWRNAINSLMKNMKTAMNGISVNDGKISYTQMPKVNVSKFKDGGFPTSGDLFFANENGIPEYITSVGNRSAVANQDQMVSALSGAILTAMSRIPTNTQPSNVVVYLGNEKLYEGQGQYQNRQNDRYGTTVVKI